MKVQANKVKIGETLKIGRHTILVSEIIKDNLKNGTKILFFSGIVKTNFINKYGKKSKPYFSEKYNSYFKETTIVNLI